MSEKQFVDQLIETVNRFADGVAIRPSDSHTLGIPDVLGWIPVTHAGYGPPTVWAVGIEAKEVSPLMEDPFKKGRRTGKMLKHAFTGPQISMLRRLAGAGVDAFGLVRLSSDVAIRVEPSGIPAKTGNFTHEELLEVGLVIHRKNGRWHFWEEDFVGNAAKRSG